MEDSNIISNAIASLEMENLHLSAFNREIAFEWIRNEIDMDSAIKALIDHYKVEE